MAEFASNANSSTLTKTPSFLASHGLISRMSFDPVDLSAFSTRKRLTNAQARSLANRMQEVWNFVREEMAKS